MSWSDFLLIDALADRSNAEHAARLATFKADRAKAEADQQLAYARRAAAAAEERAAAERDERLLLAIDAEARAWAYETAARYVTEGRIQSARFQPFVDRLYARQLEELTRERHQRGDYTRDELEEIRERERRQARRDFEARQLATYGPNWRDRFDAAAERQVRRNQRVMFFDRWLKWPLIAAGVLYFIAVVAAHG